MYTFLFKPIFTSCSPIAAGAGEVTSTSFKKRSDDDGGQPVSHHRKHNSDFSNSEPKTFGFTEFYNVRFCKERSREWSTTGVWDYIRDGNDPDTCALVSDESSYNMGWVGQREPTSLSWTDYSCRLNLDFDIKRDNSSSTRSLVTYAAATSSTFKKLNGYACSVEK